MKEHCIDSWAKTKAEYIWKAEKNKPNVLKKVQERASVGEILQEVENNKQNKKIPRYFDVDWQCIKKYIPKHIEKDLNQ